MTVHKYNELRQIDNSNDNDHDNEQDNDVDDDYEQDSDDVDDDYVHLKDSRTSLAQCLHTTLHRRETEGIGGREGWWEGSTSSVINDMASGPTNIYPFCKLSGVLLQ